MLRPAFLALLLAVPARAGGPKPFYQLDETRLAKELKRLHKKNPKLQDRVEAVSARFLGTPYKLGPLGEGEDGEFDRDPLWSFAQADCTTFVEQVMALSLTPDLADALDNTLRKIRYRDGKIGYFTRNHFTEADWVPRNVWAGYLRDITRQVAGERTVEVAKVVDKHQWYLEKSTADIEGRFTEAQKLKALPKLRALGEGLEPQRAALDVMPMDLLSDALDRIPSGTIANLVREPLPDKETMVSHQVFIIKKDGRAFVRHAAFGKQVMDVPALEYFYKYYNSRWRLVGLNLNAVRDPKQPEAPKP
jgi:hypothetical protein